MKKYICMIGYANYPSDARVRREAETLASTGQFEVSFVALREEGLAKSYELEKVKVIELNVEKYRGQNKFKHLKSYMKFIFLAFLRCNKLFFARQLDVVHIHNMPNFLALAGVLPRFFGKKMILDIHDSTPETYFAKYGKPPNQLIYRILCWEEALFCSLANNIICVNHVQRDALVKRGIPAQKITISMNTPDPRWFRAAYKIKNNKRNKEIKLVYHGTIAKRLGIDLAIRAFAKICDANASVEFYIIGEGEGLDECVELSTLFDVDEYVHFSKKKVPLENLPRILEDMDIGIIANRENAATELMLPVKLLEYIALDIPVVAPRLRAIEYYFTDEMISYFEPDSVDSLAHAISHLLNNEIRRNDQAGKAKTFLDRYGWEKHQTHLINLYKEI